MMTKFTLGDASGQALAGKAHTNAVIALAVAGDMLVSCGLDDTLRAYSLASFSPAGDAVALGGAPSGLALAPDGSVCVVTTNKAILVLTRQGTGWAQASTTAITFGALGVAMAPNKTEVVVACDDNQLRVYALAGTALSPSPALTQHKSAVTCVGYSPCGRLLASADAGKEVSCSLHPACTLCASTCAWMCVCARGSLVCLQIVVYCVSRCDRWALRARSRLSFGTQPPRRSSRAATRSINPKSPVSTGRQTPDGFLPPSSPCSLPCRPPLFSHPTSFLPSYVFRWLRLSRVRSL